MKLTQERRRHPVEATSLGSTNGIVPMPRAACPIGEVEGDAGPFPQQHQVQEIERLCIVERVSKALRRTGYLALHYIDVSVRDGVVLLEGQVASYYQKQLAQEAVRHAFGDAIIRNELEVISSTLMHKSLIMHKD